MLTEEEEEEERNRTEEIPSRRLRLCKKEIVQKKYTVADCDCVKKEIVQKKYTVADCDCVTICLYNDL